MRKLPFVLILLIPSTMLAQRDATNQPRERTLPSIIKGSGEIEEPQRPTSPMIPPIPALMTPEQMAKLVGTVGLALTGGQWRVTPTDMVAEGKSSLSFSEVAYMGSGFGGPFAIIYGRTPGAVIVHLRALLPGEKQSVFCNVAPGHPGYRLIGPNGVTRTYDNATRLDFVWEATDKLAAGFKIERAFSNENWFFFSCEISRVQ